MSISYPNALRVVVIGFAVVVATLLPRPVDAQACFEHIANYTYSPTNCSAQPDIDRVFRLQKITWKGHKYLFVDEGNEIQIFNIDNPLNPNAGPSSFFNIPNVGDSDYDLYNFSVCDDCRYGIASYKAATVLFDLGTGATPNFVASSKNFTANIIQGGFTFENGAQQYLVASSLGDECPDYVSGLYMFNGVDEGGNPRIGCLDNGGSGAKIVNGIYIGSANPPVVYMSERFDNFRIYQVQTSPTFGLNYIGNGNISRANMFRGYGVDVDEAAGLMAVAEDGKLYTYDIGHTSGSPASPVLRSTKTLTTPDGANAVAIKYPIVHVGRQNSPDEPSTWDVSNPSNPVPLDQGFWDPSHAWNSLGDCMFTNQAVFSDDGAALYFSRYSVMQVIDPTECSGPLEPLANLTLNPQPAFPGDTVTLTNTSVSGDRYARWITDGASPHGSTVLAGTENFSTTNNPLNYTLPVDMLGVDVFWAHAAVETDEFPYVQGSTPDQIKSVQISIDRTPQATIEISPQAAITGDTITLTAVAEGHPGGAPVPFEWTVTDPSSNSDPYTGNPVTGIDLDESGQWTVDLTVNYEHLVSGDPYSYQTQLLKTISSVAANFGISPSAPLHNQAITLSSTSRAQGGAVLDFDWDVVEPNGGPLVHELGFCDGPGTVNDQCVIPAETLTWGTYDFRLTLTNSTPEPDDVSVVLVEDFVIENGNIQIDFMISNSNPEIGQYVGFNITGVAANDIEEALWTFGGTGCDGSSTYTCVSPNFPGCDQAAFAYASSGTKTVRLTVTTTGGVVQPQVSDTLTVQSTGSCGGPSCTYSVSPTFRNVSSDGGSYGFDVITQSGCTWSASESASWMTITGPSSGTGSGTVTYQVNANTGPARSAGITAGGRVHTVVQEAGNGCSYAIDPTQHSFSGLGGTASVNITTVVGCEWSAATPDSWITLTSPITGTGSGSISYEVEENVEGPRIGAVLIADQIHTVNQDSLGPCEGGDVHDDGTVENGYGWGHGSVFVQRFTPASYPYVYTDVCVAFTQAGGDPSLTFDVLVFDDDGPGGGPGTLIAAVPAVVGGVPAWLDHSFVSVGVEGAVPAVEDGSVYVGVGWDGGSEVGFYVAADESLGTPQQVGFFGPDGSTWGEIASIRE